MLKTLMFSSIVAMSFSLSALPNFDAETRIGVPGLGSWEVGLYNAPGGTLISNGQYSWTSGSPLSWKLSYNATTGNMTLFYNLVLGVYLNSISEVVANSSLNGLNFSVATDNNVKAGNSITVSSLVLTLGASNYSIPSLTASGPSKTSTVLFGQPVTSDFVLTGTTTMVFGTPMPTQDGMVFHISGSNVAVPEPSTLFLLCGMGAMILALTQPRKKMA